MTGKAKGKSGGKVATKSREPVKKIKTVKSSKTKEILALAQKPGLTNSDIARISETTPANITQTLRRYGIEREIVDDFVTNKVRILSGIQEKLLRELNGRSLEKESVHTLVVDTGIIQDKIRDILNGHSGGSGVKVIVNVGDPTKVIDVEATPL